MRKMTSLLLAFLVLAAVSSVFAGGGQQSGGAARQRVFRLADNQPDGYPTVLGDLAFAKYVEEKTNGAIKIEVYNNETLGPERVTVEQTQTGDIHFNRLGIGFLTSINPNLAALGMPYLYRDREHMFKVLDGPIGQEFLESMQRQNLLGLCWLDSGFRSFYNSKKEIKTPADMAGLKIRVQETAFMMDLIRLLGASPTPMSMGEVYASIQNGIVDGAENNWPSYVSWSHHEVARYYTLDMHTASPEMILVNLNVWNSFTDAEKKIIKDGAMEGARVERAEWIKMERESEAKARAAGAVITTLSPAEQKAFSDALAPMYEQPAYAGFRDVIQRIRNTQ